MNNYIYQNPNSLSKNFCESVIEMFEKDVLRYEGITQGGLNKNVKNTTDLMIRPNDDKWKPIFEKLASELNKHIKIYLENLSKDINTSENLKNVTSGYSFFEGSELITDTFMVQRYIKKHGKYVYHQDYYNKIDSHRVITYLWYLNTIEEGGETEFYGNYRIKPEQGKLIFFPAFWCYPHCGNIPLSDNKYIITGWMYEKRKIPDLVPAIQDKFVQRYFDNSFFKETDREWLMIEIDKYSKETDWHSLEIPFELVGSVFNFMGIKIKNLVRKLREHYSLSNDFSLNAKHIYFVKNENLDMKMKHSVSESKLNTSPEKIQDSNEEFQQSDSTVGEISVSEENNAENTYLFKFYVPLLGSIDFCMNDSTTKQLLPGNLFLFSEKNVNRTINSSDYIYGFFENN